MAPKAILDLVALVLIFLGLSLGFIALFGIRKQGTKGILVPAVVGIIINGLLVFIFATNFLAARARAQRGSETIAEFKSVAGAGGGPNARQTFQFEGLVFDYDGAYKLKANQKTGQILLQHDDSNVVLTSFHQLVDVVETLKMHASALQQDFKNQSYGGITQSGFETINGSIRSGGLVRMGYDKPGNVRVHADVYILSDETNSFSILHFYPSNRESNAKVLFQKLLQSLKDGD